VFIPRPFVFSGLVELRHQPLETGTLACPIVRSASERQADDAGSRLARRRPFSWVGRLAECSRGTPVDAGPQPHVFLRRVPDDETISGPVEADGDHARVAVGVATEGLSAHSHELNVGRPDKATRNVR
jgi:hypothetical protein